MADTDPPSPAAAEIDDELRRRRRRVEEMERLLLDQEEDRDEAVVHDEAVHEVDEAVVAAPNNAAPLQEPQNPLPQVAAIKRFSYVQTSFGIALALLIYALRSRQQFYLAMVFLSTNKLSYVVFGNALIACLIAGFDAVTGVALNGLRLAEAEGLSDFFRWNVTETCLALSTFQSDLKWDTVGQFLVLIAIKCTHQVAIQREIHVRMTQETIQVGYWHGIALPTIPKAYLKLWALLMVLQYIDLWVWEHTGSVLIDRVPSVASVNILFASEAAIMSIVSWSHLLLLYLHTLDGLLHFAHEHHYPIHRVLHVWKEYKATLKFFVELHSQATQFLFYASFFIFLVLTDYKMPINLFRKIFVSFVALKERVVGFLKYRRLMASMNRFPNATEEELNSAGHVCIICRDEMTTHDCKRLPVCHHLFHKACLREWLTQQAACPTCRSDIVANEAQESANIDAARAAAERALANADEPERAASSQETDRLSGGSRDDVQEPVVTSVGFDIANTPRIGTRKVGFSSPSTAIPFPALYKVVDESGAIVLDDKSQVVRVVPLGKVVLVQYARHDSMGISFRLPDGWVLEQSLLFLCTAPGWNLRKNG